ncbi:hypothetical protein FQN51_005416 [Onygenales sp. PD_10]|nr:hypothetical protein FQN51_005416 [Onygenales sp. PD_10]
MHIRPLQPADFSDAATLLADAFRDDEVFIHLYPGRMQYYSHYRASFLHRIKLRFSTPGWITYVAVTDPGDDGPGQPGGKIVGYAAWERKGDSDAARQWKSKNESIWCRLETFLQTIEEQYTSFFHLDKSSDASNLAAFVDATANNFPSTIFPEMWYLALLGIHPGYQRRGIGALLVNWGIERAQAEHIPAGLESSVMGSGLYQKFGFRLLSKSKWINGQWLSAMLWEPAGLSEKEIIQEAVDRANGLVNQDARTSLDHANDSRIMGQVMLVILYTQSDIEPARSAHQLTVDVEPWCLCYFLVGCPIRVPSTAFSTRFRPLGLATGRPSASKTSTLALQQHLNSSTAAAPIPEEVMDREITDEEVPRKRVKISNDEDSNSPIPPISGVESPAIEQVAPTVVAQPPTEDVQALKEVEVGITHFVSPDLPGFSGILKKRYTDFLVNEILPSGKILHLEDLGLPESFKAANRPAPAAPAPATTKSALEAATEAPKPAENSNKEAADSGATTDQPAFKLSDDDNKLLEEYFGPETAQQIIILHSRALAQPTAKASDLGRVKSDVITDRDLRTKIHHAVRRIFASRLESSTDSDGAMVITAVPVSRKGQAARGGRGGGEARRGKLGWSELGGEHLHFTIYKENKDTMEVVSFLARQMKMNAKQFGFAGTKDRRGVTVQRASAFRIYADRLLQVGKTLRNAAVGDFEYSTQRLELGELKGNEFIITLRECEFPFDPKTEGANAVSKATDIVAKSLQDLRERGYFNYYGLQRFGTFSTRTDTIGLKMLQSDYKGACESILHYNPAILAASQESSSGGPKNLISSDDVDRAEAIQIFQTTHKINQALDKMPRKFSAESNIIRHLGRSKNDFHGALGTIPRNLRLMYVHAYQSLVWNFAAGERWRLFGDKVVAGDLVLVNDFKEKDAAAAAVEEVDADGDVIVLPDAADSAPAADDMFERARALTAEEAASGKYTIFDIVLPLPGFDVLYPDNEMTNFYKEFMGSEKGGKLDPFDMRRGWKDVSLSGGYRKLLSRPGPDYSFEVKAYSKDDQQFVQTDLEKLKAKSSGEEASAQAGEMEASDEAADKLAVIIKLQLGSSQYATMALRELMKNGGVKTYKPDFGGGR